MDPRSCHDVDSEGGIPADGSEHEHAEIATVVSLRHRPGSPRAGRWPDRTGGSDPQTSFHSSYGSLCRRGKTEKLFPLRRARRACPLGPPRGRPSRPRDHVLSDGIAYALISVLGGWMASGEPMSLTYYRRRDLERYERPRRAA